MTAGISLIPGKPALIERRYSKSRTLDSLQLVLNRIHRSDILRQYRIKVYKIVSMTLLLLLLVTGALQSTKAELAGIVRDPSGLPVPEAEVRIANAGTDAELKTGTGADGSYRFFALPPGDYEITVTKQGFSALKRTGISLRVGDHLDLDLTLAVGNIDEFVEVTAAAPRIHL